MAEGLTLSRRLMLDMLALGLLLIQTLNNGLDLLVVPAYWQQVIKGALIVAAVAVDMWAAKRRAG